MNTVILKCPDCGEIVPSHATHCDCGFKAPPPPKTKPFAVGNRVMPNRFQRELDESLKRMGLERKPGESKHEHASRCRKYFIEHYASMNAYAPIVEQAAHDESQPPF